MNFAIFNFLLRQLEFLSLFIKDKIIIKNLISFLINKSFYKKLFKLWFS